MGFDRIKSSDGKKGDNILPRSSSLKDLRKTHGLVDTKNSMQPYSSLQRSNSLDATQSTQSDSPTRHSETKESKEEVPIHKILRNSLSLSHMQEYYKLKGKDALNELQDKVKNSSLDEGSIKEINLDFEQFINVKQKIASTQTSLDALNSPES